MPTNLGITTGVLKSLTFFDQQQFQGKPATKEKARGKAS
jgi:hypothetical protein